MIWSRKKRCLLWAAVILLFGGCLFLWWGCPIPKPVTDVLGPAEYQGRTLVIDAGHGGEDGGAVSPNGTVESGINLSIAKRIDAIAGLYGVPTVMLRAEDVSLHDEQAQTLREKKSADLHNRVAAVESTENACLVSIHQNIFQDSRYYGAQVFYSNEELSGAWAARTQEALRIYLDQGNERMAKVIPDSIYLMNHITCPALLIECGFLSNPGEEQLLSSPEYQEKLAVVIITVYLQEFQ